MIINHYAVEVGGEKMAGFIILSFQIREINGRKNGVFTPFVCNLQGYICAVISG